MTVPILSIKLFTSDQHMLSGSPFVINLTVDRIHVSQNYKQEKSIDVTAFPMARSTAASGRSHVIGKP